MGKVRFITMTFRFKIQNTPFPEGFEFKINIRQQSTQCLRR